MENFALFCPLINLLHQACEIPLFVILSQQIWKSGKTHPRDLGAKDVEAFLSHLATDSQVACATQRQALNALVFLYRDVLDKPLEGEIAPARSKRLPRPPTVLTQTVVQRLLAALEGKHALMAKLL